MKNDRPWASLRVPGKEHFGEGIFLCLVISVKRKGKKKEKGQLENVKEYSPEGTAKTRNFN